MSEQPERSEIWTTRNPDGSMDVHSSEAHAVIVADCARANGEIIPILRHVELREGESIIGPEERACDPGDTIVEYIPTGWRSMETAPKDECILVRGAGTPTVVEWDEDVGMWRHNYGYYDTVQLDGWFPIPDDK